MSFNTKVFIHVLIIVFAALKNITYRNCTKINISLTGIIQLNVKKLLNLVGRKIIYVDI